MRSAAAIPTAVPSAAAELIDALTQCEAAMTLEQQSGSWNVGAYFVFD